VSSVSAQYLAVAGLVFSDGTNCLFSFRFLCALVVLLGLFCLVFFASVMLNLMPVHTARIYGDHADDP